MGTLSSSFYEASEALISKLEKVVLNLRTYKDIGVRNKNHFLLLHKYQYILLLNVYVHVL